METSILTSTKKILGLAEDYDAFDLDVITHINTALSTLTDIGVGQPGFMIEDAGSDWDDFLDDTDPNFSNMKSYVYLKTRLLFDPPTSGYLITAYQQQIEQLEARMSINRENRDWIDPDPSPKPSEILPYVTWGDVVYG